MHQILSSNSRIKIASFGRTSPRVCDRTQAQISGQLPQHVAVGGEQTAEQSTIARRSAARARCWRSRLHQMSPTVNPSGKGSSASRT
jgi:hypothetical protein